MPRLAGQDLAVEALRIVKPPGLMMPLCQRPSVGDRGHAAPRRIPEE
jgi:hypothetical protein